MKQTVGIGIDLVEHERFKKALEAHGDSFLNKIFLPEEIRYAQSHTNPIPSLSVRFAAKEAVSKAFGCGIGALLGFQDIEVIRATSGAPTIRYHHKGIELCRERGVVETLLSLSHSEHYSIASVTLLSAPQSPS